MELDSDSSMFELTLFVSFCLGFDNQDDQHAFSCMVECITKASRRLRLEGLHMVKLLIWGGGGGAEWVVWKGEAGIGRVGERKKGLVQLSRFWTHGRKLPRCQ